MQLLAFKNKGKNTLGLLKGDEVVNLTELGAPDSLDSVLMQGPEALAALEELAKSATVRIPLADIEELLPPVANPTKAFAIGLNFVDHINESEVKLDIPTFPVIFTRYPSSWVGHNQAIIQPKVSKILDYEGEIVVIIGKGGRYISKDDALDHVAGYSLFNEGSIRDYQMKTHQWTIGKNFDKSGSFGPYFVSADELPAGIKGLTLQTRLNGKLLQNANTNDMIFDVATLVSVCSEACELTPGDIIIAGTPSGVGGAQKPPLFMQPGDVCEISVEGIGVLSNKIEAES